MPGPRTLYAKIWDDHVVERMDDGTCLLIVDRSLVYDGTSQPAFDGLKASGRAIRRPSAFLAMADHGVPTRRADRQAAAERGLARQLRQSCADNGVAYLPLDDDRQGIVHVVGPEQGFTQPGLLMACADSHTSSHGALGALAFGIGSSELEHIFATQTLVQSPSKTMRIHLAGTPGPAISGKDIILAILGRLGVGGGIGHAIEFCGPVIDRLPMAGRLTLCNMAVEGGARSGLIAPDAVTFDWLKGRPHAPRGAQWQAALAYWQTLRSDGGAVFDREVAIDLGDLAPQVTWGTSPDEVVAIDGSVPDPADAATAEQADSWRRSLAYMGLEPGRMIRDIAIDRVFIGSCTNSRLDDLVAAANVVRGRHLARSVTGMVVPGSGLVRKAAEAAGIDRVFIDAGFEWREPGCSMCFGSRNDMLAPKERCASTSNRNFENRQGQGGRTHLVSPAMAAAAGIAGHFCDARALVGEGVA